MIPDKPFQPLESDFGDLRERLTNKITVPIIRQRRSTEEFVDMATAPFEIIGGTAVLPFPFSEELFHQYLDGLLNDFAAYINNLGTFRAYPIIVPRRQLASVACIDFIGGAVYPFDLRCVMMFDPSYNFAEEGDEPRTGRAVKITLTTLVARVL